MGGKLLILKEQDPMRLTMKYFLFLFLLMVLSGCSDITSEGPVTPDEPAVQTQPEMRLDGTPEDPRFKYMKYDK